MAELKAAAKGERAAWDEVAARAREAVQEGGQLAVKMDADMDVLQVPRCAALRHAVLCCAMTCGSA